MGESGLFGEGNDKGAGVVGLEGFDSRCFSAERKGTPGLVLDKGEYGECSDIVRVECRRQIQEMPSGGIP